MACDSAFRFSVSSHQVGRFPVLIVTTGVSTSARNATDDAGRRSREADVTESTENNAEDISIVVKRDGCRRTADPPCGRLSRRAYSTDFPPVCIIDYF